MQQGSELFINLEYMLFNIEFKLLEAQFLQDLKKGNELLTKPYKKFVKVNDFINNF